MDNHCVMCGSYLADTGRMVCEKCEKGESKMANEKRLIDANALLRRLQKRREDLASAWRTFEAMPTDAQVQYHENLECSLIAEDLPIVDAVEVVHGRWIPSDIDVEEYEQCMSDANDWYDWECSVCHYQMSYVDPVQRKHLTNYCPNCGARMDKGEEL